MFLLCLYIKKRMKFANYSVMKNIIHPTESLVIRVADTYIDMPD